LGPDAGKVTLQPAQRKNDTVVAEIASALCTEVVRPQLGTGLYVESLARILAVHLVRNYASRPVDEAETDHRSGTPRTVARAVQAIQRDYARDVSMRDLARRLNVSPYHLSRSFKETMGMTPSRYLIEVRVESARRLLRTGAGERSLAQVAQAVGFSDQSHLTRHMKRVLGVTPGALRK
jgi:AraC family transcriptional regulator